MLNVCVMWTSCWKTDYQNLGLDRLLKISADGSVISIFFPDYPVYVDSKELMLCWAAELHDAMRTRWTDLETTCLDQGW